jgi:hypothetical protein
MIKINKKINLAQLDQELNGKGLNGTLDENNQIIEVTPADNNDATEAQLKAAIAAHIAIDEAKAKATAKAAILDRIGLTADELQTILG